MDEVGFESITKNGLSGECDWGICIAMDVFEFCFKGVNSLNMWTTGML